MKQFIEVAELRNRTLHIGSPVDPLEKKAERYYQTLLAYYGDSSAVNEGIRELAEFYHQELAAHLSPSSSDIYNTYVVLIRLFRYTFINDYISTLPICNQLLESLRQEQSTNLTLRLICLHFKLIAYIQLGEFGNGLMMVKQTERLIEKESWNWFKTKEYLFLLAMRTGRYQYAAKVLQQATDQENKAVFTQDMIRQWSLYHAYIGLLNHSKEVDETLTAPVSAPNGNFTDEELSLRLVPLDWVIPNLIVQIYSCLNSQKYDEVERLLKQAEQYLVNSRLRVENKRSYYFFKLLLLLPEVNYSRRLLLQKSIPFLWRMVTIRASNDGLNRYPNPRMEIIPYEAMWRLLLKILK